MGAPSKGKDPATLTLRGKKERSRLRNLCNRGEEKRSRITGAKFRTVIDQEKRTRRTKGTLPEKEGDDEKQVLSS